MPAGRSVLGLPTYLGSCQCPRLILPDRRRTGFDTDALPFICVCGSSRVCFLRFEVPQRITQHIGRRDCHECLAAGSLDNDTRVLVRDILRGI